MGSGYRSCDLCGFQSKSKHAFEVHQDEKHGAITQGSPPLKKNKDGDLNTTQGQHADMESEDDEEEVKNLKENLQNLKTMIEDKNQ